MEINGQFYDIPYNGKNKINEYANAFDIDNNAIDFDTINNNKDVALNAEDINAIVSKTDDLQDFFIENVNDKLQEAKTEFYSWVNNFQNCEEYINGKTYNKNDRVLYTNNGLTYMYLCLKDGTMVAPDNALNNEWLIISGTQGDKGKDGYNLNYRGEYDWQFNIYNKNDVVYVDMFDKVFYVCMNDNTEYSQRVMPWEDSDNWIYLFISMTDKLKIFDEYPDASFLNDIPYTYIFGVSTSASTVVKFYIKYPNENGAHPISILSYDSDIMMTDNRNISQFVEEYLGQD